VGARVGGIPEVVLDGITGLLVEPGDEESLRTALHRLVSDCDLRSALGNAGRKRFVERFTREKMAELTIRMYRAAISRIPRPRIPGSADHDSEVQPIGSAIG
jgi:glycosyltransferase involved in cell wall biosynthesis